MTWDFKGFGILHGLALLLFFSWSLGYWQALDDGTFWLFNDWLRQSASWAEWVALANQRWVDGMAAILMSLFILRFCLSVSGRERVRVLCLVLIMGMAFSMQAALGKLLPIERVSPTLSYDNAARVSQLMPDIRTKDASGDAFPSDHGIGFATFLLFACYRFPRRYLYAIVPLVLLMAMPRLLSGAHWLTDFLCGSVPLALITGAWLFHTPLADRLTGMMTATIMRLWLWLRSYWMT